ncbi:hypothetical protein Taro_028211, partial [Colocasia esculenta]|nr:hypothetical protein [Colocasia esculenta]
NNFSKDPFTPPLGSSTGQHHVHGFESHMVFHGASDVTKCRAFPATLKETARAWFKALPAGSISSFHQLKKSFSDYFLVGWSQPCTTASLLSVRQKKGEALLDYVKRTLGVQQSPTLADLLFIAQRHAACEESLAVSRAEQANSPRNGKNLIRSFGFSEEVSTTCLPSAAKPYRELDMTNGTTPGQELFSSEDQRGTRPKAEVFSKTSGRRALQLDLRRTHEPLDIEESRFEQNTTRKKRKKGQR